MAVQTVADGKFTYLAQKLNPGAATITVTSNLGVTAGSIFIQNDLQTEWIRFTSNTASGSYWILGGLTRDIDQVAIPIVSNSTGKTWLANQKCLLVYMHDQYFDASQGGTISGPVTFTGAVSLTGTFTIPTYLNAAARDAAIPSPTNGMEAYLITEGYFTDYQAGMWGQRSTGTSTPNASTTVAGKVELPVISEVYLGNPNGGTGAPLVITPPLLKNLYNFGDGSDGDVIISSNTTLTRDMHYNNLTINSTFTLNPNGFVIYIRGSLFGGGKIAFNGNDGSVGSAVYPYPGGAGAVALNTGTCGPNSGGTNGGKGSDNNNPGNGIASTAINPSYAVTGTNSAVGGTGGIGGSGGSFPGGTGGTLASATRGSNYNVTYDLYRALSFLMNPQRGQLLPTGSGYGGVPSATGGGGGGGANGNFGGAGGGGGGEGGKIFLYVKVIDASSTVTIESKGGAGGAGLVANTGAGGGGGGGGGGAGGVVFIVYSTGTVPTIINTGGAGGVGGNAGGNAPSTNGSAGENGPAGVSIITQI